MELRKKIAALGNGQVYRHALFYNFPGGLRFKLSEGESPLEQVFSALRKATPICEDVFAEEELMLVHLQKFLPAKRFQLRDTLCQLKLAGVRIPQNREMWLEPVPSEDDAGCEEYWINIVFALPTSHLQNLLWCAFTADFPPLHPNPQCLVYLINLTQEIIVHPYDDRGMDIISRAPKVLETLYTNYKEYLLSYDLDAMNQTFAPQNN